MDLQAPGRGARHTKLDSVSTARPAKIHRLVIGLDYVHLDNIDAVSANDLVIGGRGNMHCDPPHAHQSGCGGHSCSSRAG